MEGFRQGLRELGYIEDQNIIVDYRFGEGRDDRLGDLAAGLVSLRPDVLVALGEIVVLAVRTIATTTPIVSMTGDPVGAHLVASLARPGGNITGVSMMQGQEGLAGKRVELLKDALPAATRIGLIFYPNNPTMIENLTHAEEVAKRLGLVIRPFPVQREWTKRCKEPLFSSGHLPADMPSRGNRASGRESMNFQFLLG